VRSQENTGVAGTKNWLVSGIRSARVYRNGMSSLYGNGGVCMSVNQKMAFTTWKR